MGRQQWRLLVCSATAIALLASSLFALAWFRISLMGTALEIDLQSASLCGPEGVCTTAPLSKLKGLYPATATVSFYAGLLLLLVVIVQSASKLVTGAVHDRITRIGYVLAVATITCGFAAGYLFGPEASDLGTKIVSITVERTWAPFAFVVGTLASFAALYYASSEPTEDVVEYKPIQLDKRITPPGTKPITSSIQRVSGSIPLEGAARTARPPTQPPLDRRPITPSGGLRTEDLRSKTSSTSPPVGGRSMTPSSGLRTEDLRSKTSSTSPPLGGRSMTPSGVSRIDDLRSPPDSPPTRSLTPGGSFSRTDAQGRSLTPGGGFARSDANTPSGGFNRSDMTPTGGRSRPPTEPPFARIEDTRNRSPSQQTFGREDTRNRSPSQQSFDREDTRPRTASQQPLVARTTSPSGIAEPTRTKTSSQPPFVARTTSPSGIADPTRGKSPSQPPFVARTTSPSGIVARTTSPSGIVDPTRSKSPSQPNIDPVARARTSSSGPIDLAARLSASVPNPLEGAPNLAVSIRPPLPTPEPVPPDQIPVDPAAGLTIRKRTASASPHSEVTLTPVTGTPTVPPPPASEHASATAPASTSAPEHASATAPAPATGPAPAVASAHSSATAPTPARAAATSPAPEPTPPAASSIADAASSIADAFAPPIAIPTPPESGLLIRQRRPSAPPPVETPAGDVSMPRITVDGLENLAEALTTAATASAAATAPTATKTPELPDYIRGKIKFAVLTAELASAGIKARREDGLEKLVKWEDVVGIVARRLPADKPFESATVVDLLSTAGSTLRIVPWTRLEGHPFESKAVERARSFVNVVAAMALDAKMDSATKQFANGDASDAAQLPSVAALATHDAKVG